MPTSSAVSQATAKPSKVLNCVLNDTYTSLIGQKRFYLGWKEHSYDGYGGYSYRLREKGFRDTEDKKFFVAATSFGHIDCCGITELNMGNLKPAHDRYQDDGQFAELVAKYIERGVWWENDQRDNRILVFGGPISTPHAHSQYDVDFYKRLIEVLRSFNFKRVHAEPYKNKNSGNTIQVLVGQMPDA